jgi:hypothetical protein
MKVRLYGFEIESKCSTVSLEDLFFELNKYSGLSDTSRGLERRIYLDSGSDTDYHLGLVVTVKDQKRFCRLENDHGNLKITVENLKGRDKLMEFNFFAINKKNGIGIYQHYHQSCGVNIFGSYLITRHRKIREKRIIEDIKNEKSANNGEISPSMEKRIKRKHKGGLKFSQLIQPESLEQLLKNYKKIKAFEYEYSTLVPDKRIGIPLGKYVKKIREKLTFERNWSVSELSAGITKTIDLIKPKSGRVHVVDYSDEDMSLKIFDMPDNFGEEEYDDVAIKLNNLDIYDFGKNKVSLELIEVCRSDEYKHIFEANIR